MWCEPPQVWSQSFSKEKLMPSRSGKRDQRGDKEKTKEKRFPDSTEWQDVTVSPHVLKSSLLPMVWLLAGWQGLCLQQMRSTGQLMCWPLPEGDRSCLGVLHILTNWPPKNLPENDQGEGRSVELLLYLLPTSSGPASGVVPARLRASGKATAFLLVCASVLLFWVSVSDHLVVQGTLLWHRWAHARNKLLIKYSG